MKVQVGHKCKKYALLFYKTWNIFPFNKVEHKTISFQA